MSMGVYIKGMDLPKSCDDCPLNYDSIDCMVADNALRENGGGDFLFHHERHPNCPLVHIPPHGALIEKHDVFKLITAFPEVDKLLPVEFMEALYNLPTIIPADVPDEDYCHLRCPLAEKAEEGE